MTENKKFDIKKHWPTIRDSMIFDLNQITAEDIESLSMTRGLYSLKIEVYCKIPESEKIK
jgi:hypothetical protein